jgi:hypothetical protein
MHKGGPGASANTPRMRSGPPAPTWVSPSRLGGPARVSITRWGVLLRHAEGHTDPRDRANGGCISRCPTRGGSPGLVMREGAALACCSSRAERVVAGSRSMSDVTVSGLDPSTELRLHRLTGALLAGYRNLNTRTAYLQQLHRWFAWCTAPAQCRTHPHRAVPALVRTTGRLHRHRLPRPVRSGVTLEAHPVPLRFVDEDHGRTSSGAVPHVGEPMATPSPSLAPLTRVRMPVGRSPVALRSTGSTGRALLLRPLDRTPIHRQGQCGGGVPDGSWNL